jgi:hypothetical protein
MRYKQEGLVCQSNRLLILLDRAETEICFSMANVMFKNKMGIDRYSLKRVPNNYQHLDPLYFSLPTTYISRLARSDFMNTGSGCQVRSQSLRCRWVLDPPLHPLRQLTHL